MQAVVRRGPVPGEEVVEAGVWPEIDEAGENVGQVRVGIDAVELAGLDQRSDAGPAFRAVVKRRARVRSASRANRRGA